MSIATRRYRLLLGYVLIALPFVVYGARQATRTQANSPIDWVSPSFPARQTWEEFRQAFGSGDVVIASWPGCTLDNPDLDALLRALRTAGPFFDEQGRWLFQRVVSGRELVQTLTSPPLGLSAPDAAERLRGTLVGPDGATTCVVITFTGDGLQQRERLVSTIRLAIREICGTGESDCHLAGPVIDGLAISQAGRRALGTFLAPSAAIVLSLCWWCLGSLRAALVVFGVSVLAQWSTLALMHYTGETLSSLLIVMPPLVQLLAVAGGIHLVNYYFDAARDPAIGDPAQRAFQLGWLPCVLSAATTAIGLGSLLVSGLTPVRLFGAYASAGVLLTGGLLLALVPALFALWPAAQKVSAKKESGTFVWNGPSASGAAPKRFLTPFSADRVWSTLTGFLCRFHEPVVTAALVAMLFVGCGVTRLNTSVRLETLFAPQSRILADYRWLERHVGPLVPLEVVVHCDGACTLTFRERVELVSRIEREAKATSGIAGTISTATVLPRFPSRADPPVDNLADSVRDRPIGEHSPAVLAAYTTNDGRRPLADPLAASRPALSRLDLLREDGAAELFRVTARVSALDAIDYGPFLEALTARLARHVQDDAGKPLAGVSLNCTGVVPVIHQIQQQLMSDLFSSFLSAFAVITVVMTIAQGGIPAGLVAMVANVLPTVLLFGVLGWLGVSVDIGSVMTASVALGIAVDDTLHFLTFFRRGLDAGLDRRQAVLESYRHCGRAMVQTSLACGLGLMVFAFSDFIPTSRFAWMMLGLLAAALVGDLIVLPALLLGPVGRCFADPSAAVPPLGTWAAVCDMPPEECGPDESRF